MEKKKILLIASSFSLLASCGTNQPSPDSQSSIVSGSSMTSESSSSSDEQSSSSSISVPDFRTNRFKEALQKDYSNMTVHYAMSGDGDMVEEAYEYYLGERGHDFVAVYDGSTAAAYGGEYAWMYYSYYEGKSYAWWSEVSSGWINQGAYGQVGIDYAYFFMPYLLSTLTKDDVTQITSGTYLVNVDKTEEVVLKGLPFTLMTNDITYIQIELDSDDYISVIKGYDDPNNEDVGFEMALSSFGTTSLSTMESSLPPDISESTIKTYEEITGRQIPVDVYINELHLNVVDAVEKDDDYDIIMGIDDGPVDLSYSYSPADANKLDVKWVSTNSDVAEFDVVMNWESKHKYLSPLSVGETTIYIIYATADGSTIKSEELRVKVNPIKDIDTENAVYQFSILGEEEQAKDGEYLINAKNKIESEAPFSISSWRISTLQGRYCEGFEDYNYVLASSPSSTTNWNDGFYDTLRFDFDSQQVSSLSFLYGLQRSSHKVNADALKTALLRTSNDGETWKEISIIDTMKTEFAKASTSYDFVPRLMELSFAPSSMVELYFDASKAGSNFTITMADFTFSTNENCHNYDDPEPTPVSSVSINAPSDRLKVGKAMKLSGSVLPNDATNKNLIYYSSDESILSVNRRTGVVTALAEGSAKIYATSSDGKVKSNEIEITVYSQGSIEDGDVLATYFAKNVLVEYEGKNFNISLKIEAAKATLTMEKLAKPVSTVSFALEYDYEKDGTYYFVTEDNDLVSVYFSEDKETAYLSYLFVEENEYYLGNATSGIALAK